MPSVSRTTSTSSKSKTNLRTSSPDAETTVSEQETQPQQSKKNKKNAAARRSQNNVVPDNVSTTEVAIGEEEREKEEEVSTAYSASNVDRIPRTFPSPEKKSESSHIQDDIVATVEGDPGHYTPPKHDWLEDAVSDRSPTARLMDAISQSSPPAEPGFSTRGVYETKSPLVSSPPYLQSRPISYRTSAPSVPLPPSRASTSPYRPSSGVYGSPPAPHLPQQHFYRTSDLSLGFSRASYLQPYEEPSLVRYTRLPSGYSSSRQGVILGFDSRLSILRLENDTFDEIGVLNGLSGNVIDAVLLGWSIGGTSAVAKSPLVAIIIHGPKEQSSVEDIHASEIKRTSYQHLNLPSVEFTTRVEIHSLLTLKCLAVLLETPGQTMQPAMRGTTLTPPNPIGNLKLRIGGDFLIVTSGSSGEVYVFTPLEEPHLGFECIAKVWTSIQPTSQRRDSSHHTSGDADISPADLGRAVGTSEYGIASINGRWLAICPAIPPYRPSLNATLGPEVRCGRQAGVESTSPPLRPSITCEVDSPDVDTLFNKVARGVAQELVKGAKWLGDQGYQTWQNYWRREQAPSGPTVQLTYSPPVLPVSYANNVFPPTHGENSQKSKEPELVAIYDLRTICDTVRQKAIDEVKPLATFQPPRGCSFVSFAPHGLNLLTAGTKGDVQYVWDLMQIKNCRTTSATNEDERIRALPRVRQIAKYERLSGSIITDIAWDLSTGARFATLTKNKTIHLFDLPSSASKWPPPRMPKTSRPASRSAESTQQETSIAGGFFASAMNIANQAQPMLASWRGRAPSMGAGLSGIGQTGIGLASATGARGGKVVAASLSKSLGAASGTVNNIRNAGENRLHLKSKEPAIAGRIFWIQRGRKLFLAVLEADVVNQYQVRRSKAQDRRDKDGVTVFEARKAAEMKLLKPSRTSADTSTIANMRDTSATISHTSSGFCKLRIPERAPHQPLLHPLSFAEIETNAPYQPFHSDRRVNLCIYSDSSQASDSQLPTVSSIFGNQSKSRSIGETQSKWIFGDEIPTARLHTNKLQISDDENLYGGSVIYRETMKVNSPTAGDGEMEQIVSTTRRRKIKKGQDTLSMVGEDAEREDGFFENDCDVLDFATDRV